MYVTPLNFEQVLDWIDYGTLNELKYHFQDILSSDLWSIYMDEFRTAR